MNKWCQNEAVVLAAVKSCRCYVNRESGGSFSDAGLDGEHEQCIWLFSFFSRVALHESLRTSFH